MALEKRANELILAVDDSINEVEISVAVAKDVASK